jgi:hypothetical protein
MNSVPPRFRAAVVFLALGAAVLVIGGASYGWASAGYLAPVVIAIAAGYALLARRDTDAGAVIRREVDERQAHQRLQVQALVGRALSLAVAVAYLVAVATHARLWPFAVLLGILAAAFLAGWLIYGEHGAGRGGDTGTPGDRRRRLVR